MKIHYNVSENRILEMLRDMEAFMPQSSLNKWMHEIMKENAASIAGLFLTTECVLVDKPEIMTLTLRCGKMCLSRTLSSYQT